jgi:hypothetical protein
LTSTPRTAGIVMLLLKLYLSSTARSAMGSLGEKTSRAVAVAVMPLQSA